MTRKRLLVYSWMVVAGYIAASLAFHAVGRSYTADGGNPMLADFNTFYAVSMVSERGAAATAYDPAQMHSVEKEAVQLSYDGRLAESQLATVPLFPWFYPPTFLLLTAPLAALPYFAAYVGWVAATLGLYIAAMRAIAPGVIALGLALAFPATLVNAMFGQNGFLTAGLLGLGLALIDRRPIVAGVLIGLLSVKPHFGVLLPLALMAGGHWRTFAAAAVTVLGVAALSLMVFGADPWTAFLLNGISGGGQAMEGGVAPWTLMPTTFAAVRVAGGGIPLAYTLHAAVALAAAAAVVWAWRQAGPSALKSSVLCLGVLLTTPFAYTYDLMILALPLAWLALDMKSGWRRWEAAAMAAAAVLPFAATGFAKYLSVQIGPLVLAALLAVALLRLRRAA